MFPTRHFRTRKTLLLRRNIDDAVRNVRNVRNYYLKVDRGLSSSSFLPLCLPTLRPVVNSPQWRP